MRLMPHLWAYAARNPSFGAAWRERVFEPPRARLTQLLERGITLGVLPASLDRDFALALLLGPVTYCHILRRVHGSAPENLPEQVVGTFWEAHAIAPPDAKRPRRRARRALGAQ
jgi:hypothetical protein